jgi:hypothetical protein
VPPVLWNLSNLSLFLCFFLFYDERSGIDFRALTAQTLPPSPSPSLLVYVCCVCLCVICVMGLENGVDDDDDNDGKVFFVIITTPIHS